MRTLHALEIDTISGGLNREILDTPIFLLSLSQIFEGVADFVAGAATNDPEFMAAYPWLEKHFHKMNTIS